MDASTRTTMNFRIVGSELPGLRFGTSSGALVDRYPVYLGIQRKDEVVDLMPGDSEGVVFNFPVDLVRSGRDLDFRGPFVHGVRGKRFLYLSWGVQGEDGSFLMFRRAKFPLSSIKAEEISRLSGSALSRYVVECSVKLTDEGGGPVCGTRFSKNVRWRVRRDH